MQSESLWRISMILGNDYGKVKSAFDSCLREYRNDLNHAAFIDIKFEPKRLVLILSVKNL